jgi:hypothetical protein
MTPRPGLDTSLLPRGVSVYTDPRRALKESPNSNKVQEIDPGRLKNLTLEADPVDPMHFGIRPGTEEQLKDWVDSRPKLDQGGFPHDYTKELRSAVVREIKKHDLFP